MSENQIYFSLDKVFELMMENKLREGMDDTLLEKLLSIFKLNISQDYSGIQNLLLKTQFLQLAEKVIISLNQRTAEFSSAVKKFTIELAGVLFGNNTVFVLYKDSIILRELSNALRKNITSIYLPTIQSALLLCCTSIIKHLEGIMWFKEQSLIQFVFSSFSSSSYHVRAKAISFFTEILSLWTSSNMDLLSTQAQVLVNEFFESIVVDLVSGIHLDCVNTRSNADDCCLLALKDSLEIVNVKKLINNSSVLKKQFSHYFGCLTKSDIVNENILSFLLCIFSSGGVSEQFIQDILKLLTSNCLFASAIEMVGSILRDSEQYSSISPSDIQFLTLPLKILAGNMLQIDKNVGFGLSCQEIYEYLLKALETKSDCIKIIVSSVLSLSKLTSFMNIEALDDTVMSISIAVTGPTSCQHHPMSYLCLENRKISFALSDLFASLLKENVYAAMNIQIQIKLINYLMYVIEKPFDYNVATETLKLLGILINLNEKFSIQLPEDIKTKFVLLLCKKLMDKTETIAICALSLASVIIEKDGNQFWKDAILKQSVHQIIWEMGVNGIQDGMLKAASLQATLQVCRNPHFWADIQSSKKVNEEDMMKFFFHYYHDPDFYVQRESLTCIFEWLKDKETELPLTCNDPLLIILWKAMKSLDIDQKVMVMKAWTWIIESKRFFPGVSKNIDNLLKTACQLGFASSLIMAAEDYDESIQYQATQILINFRKTLLKMGCTANYRVVDDLELDLPQIKLVNEFNLKTISKEEKDSGIENVMKLTTSEQIAKLAFIPETCNDINSTESDPVQMDHLAFPVNSFLKHLWSSNLDCIISKPVESTDMFSDYTLSLLDDIIASDMKDICPTSDDIPDCY